MTKRILCVDDESNILLGYQRALRKRFHIEVALGGEEALSAISQQGPYAVIVSDMRMPGMNGVELLARVRQIAPDTVRMMLTGNSDQQTALNAVNEGRIFRFMTKPCPPEEFARALEAGLAQHRLIVAERELLSKTLSGSVKVLTDVLSLVSPAAFSRAARVRRLARQMAQTLGEKDVWIVEIAAMLSQIGCVALPQDVLTRMARGEELSPSEAEALAAHPLVGRDLLKSIPRLEGVAEIVGYQEKRFDGGGTPPDDRRGKAIPPGARLLKVALDFDALVSAGATYEIAVAELRHRSGWYDPEALDALQKSLNVRQAHVVRKVQVHQLTDGMILAADVKSQQGTLLCAKGQEVSAVLRLRLKNYVHNMGLPGTVEVFVPIELAEPNAAVHNGLSAEPNVEASEIR